MTGIDAAMETSKVPYAFPDYSQQACANRPVIGAAFAALFVGPFVARTIHISTLR